MSDKNRFTSSTQYDDVQTLLAIANGTYDGVDLTVKFANEIANFANEWQWIQNRLNTRNFKGLNIHDYIPINCYGEVHQMQIAGINTYKGTGDSGNVVDDHIDWISRDCISQTVQWNTTNNNNGTQAQPNPFLASNLHTWLVDTVYPTLDAKVKNVIKDKRMHVPNRYQNGVTLTDDNSGHWDYLDKLWIPFEGEIFDDTVWSTRSYGNWYAVQYPIFANSYKARIKGAGPGGARTPWWEASAHSGNSTHACNVAGAGIAVSGSASGAIRVSVGFRTEREAD